MHPHRLAGWDGYWESITRKVRRPWTSMNRISPIRLSVITSGIGQFVFMIHRSALLFPYLT